MSIPTDRVHHTHTQLEMSRGTRNAYNYIMAGI